MRFSASGCFYSLWILKMHLFIIFIFLRSRLTAQVFPGWDVWSFVCAHCQLDYFLTVKDVPYFIYVSYGFPPFLYVL